MTSREQLRVLVAPDSFKGTLSAAEVAGAIVKGARSAGAEAEACPVADGGEGTLEVLLAALGGERHHLEVQDPLGRPVAASFALLGNGTAIVETAQAGGLALIDERDRDPEASSTYGVGELIAAAAATGAPRVLLGVGGSATTDGGAGAAAAIFASGGLRGVELTILCDVTTPFEQAAEIFGPQKGADREAVKRLTRRLHELADTLPRDPRGMPMTGCAGGLSGGLWAVFGATLVPGADAVLDAVSFDRRLALADAVVTGEGRLDAQSSQGKIVGEIARRARRLGVPAHAIVGQTDLDPQAASRLGLGSVDQASTLEELTAAAGELVADLRRARR